MFVIPERLLGPIGVHDSKIIKAWFYSFSTCQSQQLQHTHDHLIQTIETVTLQQYGISNRKPSNIPLELSMNPIPNSNLSSQHLPSGNQTVEAIGHT